MNTDIRKADKKFEIQAKYVGRLIPYLRKHGLQSVSMEEISRMMEISRATLYKYFSTKEEIIGFIVEGYIDYIGELPSSPLNSDQSFGIRFQQIFEQSVSLSQYFMEVFIKELETSYPEWYKRWNEAMKQREQLILAFYEEGISRGIFHDINGKLLIMQDEILREIFTVKYLMTNQLTIQQILSDYYQLKKIQLFKPDKLSAVDDVFMIPRFEHLTQKITNNLF